MQKWMFNLVSFKMETNSKSGQKKKKREIRMYSIFMLIAMRESLDRGNLSCGWSGPVIASPRWMLGYYEDYWVSGGCIISVIVLVSV
ncbi:hypothetical protein M747DRAFT_129587 [Aspergillus niger ATCC 13496]|uniref:Uncharacterized protein n=1 Tax=Aspergillus niger ATCC 13496 TaxID=1353008 RepID=A0A370BNB1_ASPNG|nr:hypothetical protein M747DRAFT_129587 [Aspergillus niger ATCC 13496]